MGIVIPYIGKSFDETCEVMGIGDVFEKLDAGILPSDGNVKIDSGDLRTEPQKETAEHTEVNTSERQVKTCSFSCQTCGKDCKRFEEVEISRGEWEMWCYCADCDIETFHPFTFHPFTEASNG